jgi:hypothetical protein
MRDHAHFTGQSILRDDGHEAGSVLLQAVQVDHGGRIQRCGTAAQGLDVIEDSCESWAHE